MHTTMIAVIAMSVLFQFIAALFALRLIPITGKKTAWLLVAFAISLMTVRRFQSLVLLVSGQSSAAPDVYFEGRPSSGNANGRRRPSWKPRNSSHSF